MLKTLTTAEREAVEELLSFAEMHIDETYEGEEWEEQHKALHNAIAIISDFLNW